MAGSGMILVEFTMQIPQPSVIGAVLPATIEALLMGALVSFANVAMEPVVCRMVALMLTVVVVVSKRRCSRCREGQHGRRHECFADGH